MTGEAITTLPESADILCRLVEFDNESHAVERLYPLIQRRMAGRETTALGLVLGLHLIIADYTEGMPPVMESVMLYRLPEFVRVLVDDEEVRNETLGILAEQGLC